MRMKGLLIGAGAVALLAVAGALWLQRGGGVAGLVDMALPEFPAFPEPRRSLDADSSGEIYFASATPFDLDVILDGMRSALPTTATGRLYLPEGASPEHPVPAMVVLHGSGGISPGRERQYGEQLAANGYAAFVLDYYRPRGITDDTHYMLRVLSVTEFDALTDAYAALELLGTHPAIDAKRIGVMGFSYGGMAARFAMDARLRDALAPDAPPFAVHVDYYGPCFQDLGGARTTGAPLLTLRGDQDASNDLAACLEREAELRAAGSEVEAEVYAGAGHAWEVDMPREIIEDAPYVAGCEVGYDERGHSQVDGSSIVDVPPDTSRVERIAIRLRSGDAMRECVHNGYLIGKDDATKRKSDQALLAFLERRL